MHSASSPPKYLSTDTPTTARPLLEIHWAELEAAEFSERRWGAAFVLRGSFPADERTSEVSYSVRPWQPLCSDTSLSIHKCGHVQSSVCTVRYAHICRHVHIYIYIYIHGYAWYVDSGVFR